MSFHLKQSGTIRRPGLEISVADFKGRAAAGFIFWRGVVVGMLSGLALSYALFSGAIARLWQ